MTKRWSLFAAVLMTALIVCRVGAVAAVEFERDISPSLALVSVPVVRKNGTTAVDYGSAFCISSSRFLSYYLTANHVIQDATTGSAIKIARYKPSNEELDAAIEARGDSKTDIAVLSVKKSCAKPMAFEPRTITEPVDIGVAGFPESLIEALRQHHSISGPARVPGNISALLDNGFLLQLNAGTVDCGSSGGPIYDPGTGFAMGITVAKYASGQKDVCSPLGSNDVDYALPSQAVILPFLKTKQIPFTLPAAVSTDAKGTWKVSGRFGSMVDFGHYPQTCNYRVEMHVEELAITLNRASVTGGRLQVHQRELTTSPCPYTPVPVNDQLLDFVSGTVSGKIVDFIFHGRSGNWELSNAAFHGEFSDESHLDGTITFFRMDQPTPWKWSMPIQIVLRPA